MQKYSVATSKGLVHTADFDSARKVLAMEFEIQKQKFIERKEKEKYKYNPLLDKLYKI